jgi:hypothetical protein
MAVRRVQTLLFASSTDRLRTVGDLAARFQIYSATANAIVDDKADVAATITALFANAMSVPGLPKPKTCLAYQAQHRIRLR